jgi:hypothetical protein
MQYTGRRASRPQSSNHVVRCWDSLNEIVEFQYNVNTIQYNTIQMGYKFNTNDYKYRFQYKWDGRRELREDDTAGNYMNCSQLKRKVNK